MWIGSLGPRMFWGTRATNFTIYTTKMKVAGPQILGTGAKFKRVPCQKSCRVNRALMSTDLYVLYKIYKASLVYALLSLMTSIIESVVFKRETKCFK